MIQGHEKEHDTKEGRKLGLKKEREEKKRKRKRKEKEETLSSLPLVPSPKALVISEGATTDSVALPVNPITIVKTERSEGNEQQQQQLVSPNTNDDETKEERKLRRKKKRKEEKEKKKKRKRKDKTNASPSLISVLDEYKQVNVVTADDNTNDDVHTATTVDVPQVDSNLSRVNDSNLTYDHQEQQQLLDDIECPFRLKKVRFLISILPAALNNIDKAINGMMSSLLLRYTYGVGGVLLSFENIQFENNVNDGSKGKDGGSGYGGIILDEMPHIHYNITSDIVVFSPTIGKRLNGIVNESFPSHVGILVYNLFNAMVNADSLRESGFSFDIELNEWSKNETDAVIQIDDMMVFTVETIHQCSGLISMECSTPSIIRNGR